MLRTTSSDDDAQGSALKNGPPTACAACVEGKVGSF
jgi:hypothetical protein